MQVELYLFRDGRISKRRAPQLRLIKPCAVNTLWRGNRHLFEVQCPHYITILC